MYDTIENLNYARDPRTQGPARKPVLYDEFGDEIELPTKKAVCPVCDGEGKHVNPSIDASGLSAEDFADDPDFADDYMSGVYDVTCNRCGGKNVVDVVDWDRLTDEQRKAYEQQLEEEAQDRAIELAEIRAGC